MSVLIKGVGMPKDGEHPYWAVIHSDGTVEYNENKGQGWQTSEAVPVPPHGRLGDLDALITTFCEWGTRLERGRKLVITMGEAKQAIVDIIDSAPTIIPAEETIKEATNDQNNS